MLLHVKEIQQLGFESHVTIEDALGGSKEEQYLIMKAGK